MSDSKGLDRFHPNDLAFFANFQLQGARLAQPPANLEEAAKRATAVIVAEVADVQLTRTIVGETARDTIPMAGIVLRPVDVLQGQLQPELEEVVVEFVATSMVDSEDAVEALRQRLPTGQSVWFLSWQGLRPPPPAGKPGAAPPDTVDKTLYGLVHMQGVFMQGKDRVLCPMVENDPPGYPATMQRDGESLARLSDLVNKVRTLR